VPAGDESTPGHERLATPPNPTVTRGGIERVEVAPAGADDGGDGGGVDVRHARAEDIDRRAARRAERLIAFWFTVSTVGTLAFTVMNFVGDKHKQYYTPVLGVTMALAVGGLGIGMIIWAKRLMPHEIAVQERHTLVSPPAEYEALEEAAGDGFRGTQIASRPLLRRAFLGAAAALGGFLVVPLLNLNNRAPKKDLFHTSWVKGARLVTGEGTPLKIGDLDIGAIATVFPAVPVREANGEVRYEPKTSVHERADSATIIVRLPPDANRPRKGRENWAYDGHVAYSKICTHAGCPVSLYEQQTHHLLCPCHQSVFDARDGARAIFGPASRSLPQLAITIDDDGYFVAKDGDYTEPVGPGFWERG
jgi:ubiquinol-cytochrome c reductase iron-sulfur subunit